MQMKWISIAGAWHAFWHDWWRDWQLPGSPRRSPVWSQLLGTALFGLAIALAMTLAGVLIVGPVAAWRRAPEYLASNLVITLSVSYSIHGMYEVMLRLVGRHRASRMSRGMSAAYHGSVTITGVLIGWAIGLALLGKDVIGYVASHASDLRASLLFSLLITVAIWVWFSTRAEKAEAHRRAAEAQLRLLQGQIEPHFLFNTLANVLSLMDTDTPRARQMLETFIDYLRASLGQMRHEAHTLGQELALVQRYLELLQMRMVDRLRFRIEADPALRELPLPPLLVQPLVENAVHHGLEPKIDGGEVRVRVRTEGRMLVIEVLDDGLGLDAPHRPRKGHGLALANIRQRIASRYGEQATLDLQRLAVGTRALLSLPLDTPQTGSAP